MQKFELKDICFFDCETTGVPAKGLKWDADFEQFPHVVQLAWSLGDKEKSYIIKPDNYEIPPKTQCPNNSRCISTLKRISILKLRISIRGLYPRLIQYWYSSRSVSKYGSIALHIPGSDWFRYRVGVVELNIAPAFGLFRLKLGFELFRRVFLLR
jgi:hypothetical protein